MQFVRARHARMRAPPCQNGPTSDDDKMSRTQRQAWRQGGPPSGGTERVGPHTFLLSTTPRLDSPPSSRCRPDEGYKVQGRKFSVP